MFVQKEEVQVVCQAACLVAWEAECLTWAVHLLVLVVLDPLLRRSTKYRQAVSGFATCFVSRSFVVTECLVIVGFNISFCLQLVFLCDLADCFLNEM